MKDKLPRNMNEEGFYVYHKTLYILRGVSGCGKSTLAWELSDLTRVSEVFGEDDYYNRSGEYKFDLSEEERAYETLIDNVKEAMDNKVLTIVVHSVMKYMKYMELLIENAKEYGYKVVSLIVENRHGSSDIHSVPEKELSTQESKIRNNLKLR